MEILETFVPSDSPTHEDDSFGNTRSRPRNNRRGGYQPNTRFRKPQTPNGVILSVELDRDMLAKMKDICGERSIFWGIREACHRFVENYDESASHDENER